MLINIKELKSATVAIKVESAPTNIKKRFVFDRRKHIIKLTEARISKIRNKIFNGEEK